MAVEKLEDGTYRVGRRTFGTSDEAFAYDAASRDTGELPVQPGARTRPERSAVTTATGGPSARSRAPALLAAVIVSVVVAVLYFGPHWTIYRMKSAIDAKDATAFSSYVDFPALKESVKAQLMLKMNDMMKSDGMKDIPFAGLGQMIGMGVINQMVESLVSPAGVMLMMEQGKAAPLKSSAPQPEAEAKPKPDFAIDYINFSTAEVRSKDGSSVRFVLHRDGLFTWKLSEMQIPP